MTLTVVDLGCADPERRNWSLGHLVADYHPDRAYGFDPSPTTNTDLVSLNGTPVTIRRQAAWVYDGELWFTANGTGSRVSADGGETLVECFDFSAWLRTLDGDRVIVKMDVEGAEYPLLTRMVADNTDQLVAELLVEWHPGPRELVEPTLRCGKVTEWRY
jgi:FkbM family methyltransferase